MDRDGSLGTRRMEWSVIQETAKRFVAGKRSGGPWRGPGKWNIRMPATYSLIEGKETIP